ncbi:C-type mannose receptor 2-like [Syngnathus acus]|uniref:C-type mannose receptor 2-like n=1 Tax=Syngnathus acus TaxID=161584 RepID=UPI001885CDA2|nr:C-type mannose receptor 2-like [Syngnathus acus]
MGSTHFWLGLSNQKCDDVWCGFVAGSQELIWSDGETTTHTNWALDQFKSADVASCAYVNQGAYRLPGRWRSGSCASSLAYMCKRPQSCPEGRTCTSNSVTAVMKTSDCDDGNFLYGDDCYLFDATRRSWEDGENFCLARRGHLASIHSEQDVQFILAKCGGPPQLPPLVGQPNWTKKCGWWLDYPESDFCYLMIRQPTMTWQEAQDDCQRLQGNLLSITDDHEQTFVHGYIKALMKASSLWLGANVTISDEGSTWADGAAFTYVHSTSGLSETVVCCHLEERRSTEIFSPAPQVPPMEIVFPSSLATATGSTTRATRRREVTKAYASS